jgi:hypothetical protein
MDIARAAWTASNSESDYPDPWSTDLESSDVRSQSHYWTSHVPGNRDVAVLAVQETDKDQVACILCIQTWYYKDVVYGLKVDKVY